MKTIGWAKREYERHRRRFFSDGVGHTIPPADQLTWGWLPENSPNLADTNFDEDGEPFEIFLAPAIRTSGRLLSRILLHEMTHIRLGPSVGGCDKPGAVWLAEAARLVALGADLL